MKGVQKSLYVYGVRKQSQPRIAPSKTYPTKSITFNDTIYVFTQKPREFDLVKIKSQDIRLQRLKLKQEWEQTKLTKLLEIQAALQLGNENDNDDENNNNSEDNNGDNVNVNDGNQMNNNDNVNDDLDIDIELNHEAESESLSISFSDSQDNDILPILQPKPRQFMQHQKEIHGNRNDQNINENINENINIGVGNDNNNSNNRNSGPSDDDYDYRSPKRKKQRQEREKRRSKSSPPKVKVDNNISTKDKIKKLEDDGIRLVDVEDIAKDTEMNKTKVGVVYVNSNWSKYDWLWACAEEVSLICMPCYDYYTAGGMECIHPNPWAIPYDPAGCQTKACRKHSVASHHEAACKVDAGAAVCSTIFYLVS